MPAVQTRDETERWCEVTFAGPGTYKTPNWVETAPVVFDWDSLRPEIITRRARRLVRAEEIDPEELRFAPGECHEMATGTCSLVEGAIAASVAGRGDYAYCRKLAVFAQLWELTRTYCGGDIPLETTELKKLMHSKPLVRHIQTNWNSRLGALPPLKRALPLALSLYGTQEHEPIELFDTGSGLLELSNGRHRICIAKHLAIPVAAFVEWEEPSAGPR